MAGYGDANRRFQSPGPGYTWNEKTQQWDPPAPPPPPPGGTTGAGDSVSYTKPGEYTSDAAPGQPAPFAGNPSIEQDDARNFDPKTAVANDVAEARRKRDEMLRNYEGYKPREAPQADTPTLGPAALAGGTTVGPAATPTAPKVGPVAGATAARATAPTPIAAPTIGTTTINPVERYSASTIGATTLDKDPQAQIRERQLALLNQLEAQAAGTAGPSAAELLAKKTSDEAISSQAALAGATSGYQSIAAMRGAAKQMASLQQQNVLNTGMIRAKEQMDARQQLLQGLEGARGTDVTVASKEADIAAARNMKQAELEQAAAAGNAAAVNELNRRNAELEADRKKSEAAMTLDANKSNQDTSTKVELTNATNETNVNVTNAGAQNRLTELQAQIDAQNGIATAQQLNEMEKLRATINADREKFNATQINDFAKTQAGMQLQTGLANLNAQLTSRGLDDAQKESLLRAYLENQRVAIGWDTTMAGLGAGKDMAWIQFTQQLIGGLISGGSSVAAAGATAGPAAAAASDRRVKTDVKALLDHYDSDGGKDEVGELLDNLRAYTYRYKDPKAPGQAPGQRFGIMAQDLEKSPMGASIVIDDGGVKKIDTAQAVGILLAAQARMHGRMKKLERR